MSYVVCRSCVFVDVSRTSDPQVFFRSSFALLLGSKPISGGITKSRRLFVGNLSFSTTWQNLKDHFQGHGTVVYSRIMMDNAIGRSKGYGFVFWHLFVIAIVE